MKEKNVLTDFENKKNTYFPIGIFFILLTGFMTIFYYFFGYEYFLLWKTYQNPEHIGTCVLYCSVASFCLGTTFAQIIIRYDFIRRNDIKYFELKT